MDPLTSFPQCLMGSRLRFSKLSLEYQPYSVRFIGIYYYFLSQGLCCSETIAWKLSPYLQYLARIEMCEVKLFMTSQKKSRPGCTKQPTKFNCLSFTSLHIIRTIEFLHHLFLCSVLPVTHFEYFVLCVYPSALLAMRPTVQES